MAWAHHRHLAGAITLSRRTRAATAHLPFARTRRRVDRGEFVACAAGRVPGDGAAARGADVGVGRCRAPGACPSGAVGTVDGVDFGAVAGVAAPGSRSATASIMRVKTAKNAATLATRGSNEFRGAAGGATCAFTGGCAAGAATPTPPAGSSSGAARPDDAGGAAGGGGGCGAAVGGSGVAARVPSRIRTPVGGSGLRAAAGVPGAGCGRWPPSARPTAVPRRRPVGRDGNRAPGPTPAQPPP